MDDEAETPPEEQMFEIAARNVIDPATATGKRFSWGVPATKERVESFFTVSIFKFISFRATGSLIAELTYIRTLTLESGKH